MPYIGRNCTRRYEGVHGKGFDISYKLRNWMESKLNIIDMNQNRSNTVGNLTYKKYT